MIKRNNQGFTLLELIISIFILTIVISLGYRVINKSTIDIKNQININKGQLTVNDMNEYLTKDLEQASNLVLTYINKQNTFTDDSQKLNNENLKNTFESYLQNKTDESFIYSYKISKQNEEVEYSVEVTKDKDDYKYNVSRKETDGVSIIFIDNEIIEKDEMLNKDEISEEYFMDTEVELPFEISLDSPYKVSLGYSGKNNKFIRYGFTVASRLNSDLGGGSTNPDTDDNDGEITGPVEASDYLNYCLNKVQSYINKLDNTETSNLINEIFKISSKEKYESNDLDSMYDYAEELIENINNIRNNCDKPYLDANQQNLNGIEYYLNVVKSILDNYNKQNNDIDRNHLNKIVNTVSQTLKYICLTSYPDGAKNKIVALKTAIMEQKNISNNNSTSIGQQVDEQAKTIDKYESNFDNKIVIDRIDKMWQMLNSIIAKTWQTDNIDNDINELSQFINDTIDIIIEFEISLKTYIYNNIPICDNIPSNLIDKINLCAEMVILKMNEANQILVSIKAQLNNVNYVQLNN